MCRMKFNFKSSTTKNFFPFFMSITMFYIMKREKSIAIRMESELYDYIRSKSKKNRTSVSHEIRVILLNELNKLKEV